MMPGDVFPREVTSHVPRITLTGLERLHVEQHRGLIAYSPEEIVFRTSVGLLRIEGGELRFGMYTAGEAVVMGRIECVCYGQRRAGHD